MTKVQAFVYKIFGNLIMFSICEKVRLQQLRKAKYSILASISHIFQESFLTDIIVQSYLLVQYCE